MMKNCFILLFVSIFSLPNVEGQYQLSASQKMNDLIPWKEGKVQYQNYENFIFDVNSSTKGIPLDSLTPIEIVKFLIEHCGNEEKRVEVYLLKERYYAKRCFFENREKVKIDKWFELRIHHQITIDDFNSKGDKYSWVKYEIKYKGKLRKVSFIQFLFDTKSNRWVVSWSSSERQNIGELLLLNVNSDILDALVTRNVPVEMKNNPIFKEVCDYVWTGDFFDVDKLSDLSRYWSDIPGKQKFYYLFEKSLGWRSE